MFDKELIFGIIMIFEDLIIKINKIVNQKLGKREENIVC